MEQTSSSEAQLISEICKASLFEFVKEFWNVIIPEKPVWSWHIKYLCDEVQYVIEKVVAGEPKTHDLIINVPPGSTKSTIVSVMAPVWAWTHLPAFRTIVATHTHTPLGINLARLSRKIVRCDKYWECFQMGLSEDQDTKGHFVNQEGGSRLTATVGGHSPLGMHAHLLIVDDPIDPKSARKVSQMDISETNRWVAEDLQSRKVDKTVVPMILIMQRLKENDPTGYWLEHGSAVKHISLPARSDEGYPVSPPELLDRYVDDMLDPQRMPKQVLEAIKQVNEFSYAAQYGQSPVPAGGGMFKVDKFLANHIEEPPESFDRVLRSWDKAATAGGGDYTAGVKMAEDQQGNIWILNVVRGQWEVDERDAIIQRTAKIDGAECPIILEEEGGSSGKFEAKYAVKALAGFQVHCERPTGSKETRAQPLASQVNIGNVFLAEGSWNQAFIDELRVFDNHAQHDDQVDAASQGYAHFFRVDPSLLDWLNSDQIF